MKLKDLKENEIYRDKLSGRLVLITVVSESKIEDKTYYTASAHVYNALSGFYDSIIPFDNQLEEV